MRQRFLADERGLETVEYAIIAGFIVVGVIATIFALGAWINGRMNGLRTQLGA